LNRRQSPAIQRTARTYACQDWTEHSHDLLMPFLIGLLDLHSEEFGFGKLIAKGSNIRTNGAVRPDVKNTG